MSEDATGSLLEILRSAEGFVSDLDLARRLGVAREDVWTRLEQLQREGYEILIGPNLGYRLVGTPDRLVPEELQRHLGTAIVGRRLVVYEETSSTMDVAHQLAMAGEPEGSCILAESQRAGRGRFGRRWMSPKGEGVYLSTIFRPALPLESVSQMTLLAAVAVTFAVRQETGVHAQVKWPNDLVIRHRKCCGILTELRAEGHAVRYLVIGIGINVNTPRERLPEQATSLLAETGQRVDRLRLCRRLLQRLDEQYAVLTTQGFASIAALWEEFSVTLGAHVCVEMARRLLEGQAVGIDRDGALLVRTNQGIVERVMAGEVRRVR